MYIRGEGVPLDYAEGVKWVRKAAEQGDTDGQLFLGLMYDKGQGVTQNYAESAKWYRKAAEQGESTAQVVLGIMYGVGLGVPQDHVQSYFWSSLAASRSSGEDHKESSDARDRAEKKLTPEKLMEAQRMTREWEKSHPRE
jgi:TPR repeat protein